MTLDVRPVRGEEELQRLGEILRLVFHFPQERVAHVIQATGPDNFRGVWDRGALAGGLAIVRMGQYFGGRAVPIAGIGLVGIAAEHRGRGAGLALMRETVRELAREGVALSTLYPATQVLYRQAGYEQAGARYEVSIPAAQIDVRDRALELRSITAADEPAVRELHRRRAEGAAGNLERGPFIWNRIRTHRGTPAQGVLLLRDGAPEGYVYSVQVDGAPLPYDLLLTDLVALTPAAGRRVLTHLADHQSLANVVRFHSWPGDPLLCLLREQRYTIRLLMHWMLRLVDLDRALTQRGYPPGVRGELHLDVRDDVLPANQRAFVLEVRDGRGAVSPGGRASIACDIRGLASLYTGFRSARDLMASGQLTASCPSDLALAGALFAGPTPWMGEMF